MTYIKLPMMRVTRMVPPPPIRITGDEGVSEYYPSTNQPVSILLETERGVVLRMSYDQHNQIGEVYISDDLLDQFIAARTTIDPKYADSPGLGSNHGKGNP